MTLQDLTMRLDKLEEKVEIIENNSTKALALSQATQASVEELLAIFNTIKGGVRFFIVTVSLLKWFAGAGAAFGVIWLAIKSAQNGKFPFIN